MSSAAVRGEAVAETADFAPANSLPDWSECSARVGNSDFIEERISNGGYGADADSKLATALHRFIYEYDDADPVRSSWFMHRLEMLIAEVSPRAADAPCEPSELATCRDDGRCQYAIDHDAEDMGHCPKGKCCMPDEENVSLETACRNLIVYLDNNPPMGESLLCVRQIRNAIDSLCVKSRAADALDSQPTVLAYVATDLDGRADVGMTREKAMERAGHGCDTIIPVYDLGNSQPAGSASQENVGDDALVDLRSDEVIAGLTKEKFMRLYHSRAPAAQAASVAKDAVIGWITTGDLEGDEVGGWDVEWDRKKIDGMPEFCQPETTYDVYLRVAAPQQEGSEAGNG